jgi:pyruvate/2-oxoglutarate dehydrogenase complex dihydrolipoamide acyltransferase (E2) component
MAHKIIFPEMGEGVFEGTLTRWLVKPGDMVEAFEPVAEVETDKVTTELMSEISGVVLELLAAEGDVVPVDAVVAVIGQEGEEAAPAPAAVKDRSTNGQSQIYRDREYRGRISPVVGRIASEHNVDLNQVVGTGKGGRITKRDIMAYVEERPPGPVATRIVEKSQPEAINQPAKPDQEKEKGRPVKVPGDELLPLDSMRRAIANHMVRSKQASPHATTVFEFDFSAVSRHRAENKKQFLQDGARLTFTVYIVAAVVEALKQHPLANSMWTEEGILLKRQINIGIAVAIADGLIVPVIKEADGLNLLGLARSINDLAERARGKDLKPDEVQGGTFSITNHGTSGSLLATPIINQPQAGILGIGKIEKRVKVIDDAIAIRPLAYASFTFDHRILDGATADAFVNTVKDRIENRV